MPDNLKMLTVEEVCELLNMNDEHLRNCSKIGIFKPIKTGRSWMYTLDDIENFERTYKGYDISNKEKAEEIFRMVGGREG